LLLVFAVTTEIIYPRKVKWQPFTLEFRQPLEGGYRYLDRCGEFMFQAENRFHFMPGETKVTGANLEMPEEGMTATVSPQELTVHQEYALDDGKLFFSTSEALSNLLREIFQPSRIPQNTFGSKTYCPMDSADGALEATLGLGDKYQTEFGKLIGMSPSYKSVDYSFSSGNRLLHVMVRAVTFNTITTQRVTAGFHASNEQVRRAERLNKKADRIGKDLKYGLLLELDLTEVDPPEGKLLALFSDLKKLEDRIKSILERV
jgi:hypothetical protein